MKHTKAKGDSGAVDLGIPYFGHKNHLSGNRRLGFVRRYEVTASNHCDGHLLSKILDKENTAGDVWENTAYHTQNNGHNLEENGFRSQIHRKKLQGKP